MNEMKNRVLKKLLVMSAIDERTYKRLYASGSKPGRLYGLPKMHKKDEPLRPIISGIGTFCHPTARFLAELLSPLTNTKYAAKDTFDFLNKLKCISMDNCFMASFDVASLFTNVPLQETIDIILHKVYDQQLVTTKIPRNELKTLILLCTTESSFMFEQDYFKQTDGVAMGSPLGPVLANIFMSTFEERLFNTQIPHNFGLKFWCRYVDDIFAIFDNKPDLADTTSELNKLHSNITFTNESEKDGKIHFLDVDICFSDGIFTTKTFLKPTNTGLYTLWTSYIPKSFKTNLFGCLLHRAMKICSTFEVVKYEFSLLKQRFIKLGYPEQILNSVIDHYLQRNTISNDENDVYYGPEKKRVYIRLPYIGSTSSIIKTELKKVVRQFANHVELSITLFGACKIKHFFPNKIAFPKRYASKVVYAIACKDCGQQYIGQTRRSLPVRLREHRLALTGRGFSCAADHCLTHSHMVDFDNAKILARDISDIRLQYKETMLINDRKPMLNNMQSSIQLHVFN